MTTLHRKCIKWKSKKIMGWQIRFGKTWFFSKCKIPLCFLTLSFPISKYYCQTIIYLWSFHLSDWKKMVRNFFFSTPIHKKHGWDKGWLLSLFEKKICRGTTEKMLLKSGVHKNEHFWCTGRIFIGTFKA